MLINKEVLAIIPARSGSKGLPGKNVKIMMDKPLIAWTIEQAKKSKYISRVIVSTNDSHIRNISAEFGAEVIERPAELCMDDSSVNLCILHALEVLQKTESYKPDFIMLLQCTSPLRTSQHIDDSIELFASSSSSASSLISVCNESCPPWWLKNIDEEGYLQDFLIYDKANLFRRQDFPNVFRLNGAIYLSRTEDFLQNMTFQSEKVVGFIMDEMSSIDIDTEFDFLFAETVLRNLKINESLAR